ncbi:MAG TPA: protein-signal peptide and transmembrane prediction [Planctomycetota bacterium]|nr:protein-signal peptide and transmembrane prediction [Planctomycetota bacterium]
MIARAALVLLLAGCASTDSADPLDLHLRPAGAARWEPSRTALVIVDMWDDHWCKGAARRVTELAGPMNEAVRDLRRRGVFVIHAPSTCADFYKGTPARLRAQQATFAKTPSPLATETRWGTGWCWPDKPREPDLPIDDSDMGCDCASKCTIREAWTRQIAAIEIDPGRDAVTDRGQETWNLLAARGITHVLVMGVHLNMCVLGRPFAIRQLSKHGLKVALVRDMTDTMYNSKMKPFVDHHTGTDLVIAHIEKHWCPSVASTDLTGRPPFRFADDPKKDRAR